MVWKLLAVVLVLVVAVALVVQHAVMDTQIRTIEDVRSSDTAGGAVAVRGTIAYASENVFLLDDGTGRAGLSTCPIWYKRISLHKGDQVTVVGQVMKNPSLAAKCDVVLSVYKIMRGTETIQVRRRPGKPPWMMGSVTEEPV